MKISIGSYNIYHGENKFTQLETGEHIIDLKETAKTIKTLGVDLCGLNEVRNQWGGEGLCNQAEAIAKELGWHYYFAKAINIPGGEYGNALASRYPIRAAHLVPIETLPEERDPDVHYENRVLLVAEVEVEGKLLTVMVCHFGLRPPEKKKAVAAVTGEMAKITTPAVFMGDLNITPDSEHYGALAAAMNDTLPDPNGAHFTFSHQDPKCKIDYIFTNGLCKPLDARVHAVGISDHRPITAEIEF
ncbi:MAG: endonuclease/exonuclease/phosphatase family protein [Clostridia bacterium]|nr:endonuclease/exonuclease/phosphatase family protein [Clostridia bacterium]